MHCQLIDKARKLIRFEKKVCLVIIVRYPGNRRLKQRKLPKKQVFPLILWHALAIIAHPEPLDNFEPFIVAEECFDTTQSYF